jgi:hypothetical protein
MAETKQPEKSEKGIYFDSKAGKVVDGPPEEGVQIVPPGGEVDADAKSDIARYNGDAPPVTAVVVDPEPADDPAPEKAPAKKAAAKKSED